jgi:hypothetical protein
MMPIIVVVMDHGIMDLDIMHHCECKCGFDAGWDMPHGLARCATCSSYSSVLRTPSCMISMSFLNHKAACEFAAEREGRLSTQMDFSAVQRLNVCNNHHQ